MIPDTNCGGDLVPLQTILADVKAQRKTLRPCQILKYWIHALEPVSRMKALSGRSDLEELARMLYAALSEEEDAVYRSIANALNVDEDAIDTARMFLFRVMQRNTCDVKSSLTNIAEILKGVRFSDWETDWLRRCIVMLCTGDCLKNTRTVRSLTAFLVGIMGTVFNSRDFSSCQ